MHQKPASEMTDAAIAAELDALDTQWTEFRQDCEMSGSPGEWMIERMGELEAEQKRRRPGYTQYTAFRP